MKTISIKFFIAQTFLFANLMLVAYADAPPLWKIADTSLQNDDRQFVVTLERAQIKEQNPNGTKLKIAVVVNSDNTLVRYYPIDVYNIPWEKITFDAGDSEEVAKLKALVDDCMAVDASSDAALQSFRASGKVEQIREQKIGSYSGSLGEYIIGYDSGMEGRYIRMDSKDGDTSKFRGIVQPSAFAFALESLTEIRNLQRKAIESKQKAIALKAQLDQETAQEEIDAAKVAADRRVQKAKEEAAEELDKMQHEKELQQIAQAAADKTAEQYKLIESARDAKLRDFLASKSGKELDEQIHDKSKKVRTRRAEETSLLRGLDYERARLAEVMQTTIVEPEA